MKDKNYIWGVWARSNKTFYYMNTGVHSVNNPVERVLNTLIAREVIEMKPGRQALHSEPYKLYTLAQAEEKKFEIEVIHHNKLAQDYASTKEKAKLSGWS